MVKLQEAKDQIVIDYEVYDRRPSDLDLLIAAIETHRATEAGRPPHMVASGMPDSTPPRTRQQREPRKTRLHSQPLDQEFRAQA